MNHNVNHGQHPPQNQGNNQGRNQVAAPGAGANSGQKPNKKQGKKRRPLWLRIILAFLKYIIVPVLCVFALIVGMMLGYSYLGKQDPSEVLQWNTWKHLYDLIFAT